MKITFLGAVEEVTGSRYLIEQDNIKILVDCGMFQGPKEIRERNDKPFPIDPKSIHAVILTHAHIDHSGYIPALVKNGFAGKIYCSKATFVLCSLLLRDSGRLQESAVRNSNERGGPDHPPLVALYTERDAENSLSSFQPVEYDTEIKLGATLTAKIIRSGHILGSSFVVLSDGKETLTFSGDLGRPQQDILKTPPYLTHTDYLVIESTYGNRLHEKGDPTEMLREIINETVAKGGVIIIPCFAVGRTQTILYCLYQLKKRNAIPAIPIYLDSPMAISVTEMLAEFPEEHTLSPQVTEGVSSVATFSRTGEDSKQLDHLTSPAIIIAGSGMADGGRVMFHLQHYISDPRNTVLFVGYQAENTTGHKLVTGRKLVNIQGETFTVHAGIKEIGMLSAHADYSEVLEWLSHFDKIKKVFVTHGELEDARALQARIKERFGWQVVVPKYKESFELD